MTHYEIASLVTTGAGVAVGIAVLVVYGKQLTQMRRATEATGIAAQAASDAVIEARKSAVVAGQSAKAAADSATVAADTLKTNQEIERAYMRMSYDGLLFIERKRWPKVLPQENDANPDTVSVVIYLTNVGRTPGDIVGGWCGFLYQPASDKPKLLPAMDSSTKLTPLFVLPDQSIDFALQLPLTKTKLLFLRQGEPEDGSWTVEGKDLPVKDPMHLWLAGEIDYKDRFGHFHRAGYATRWDRHAYRFLWDPTVADLNYDRSMSPDEITTRAYKS